MIEQNKATALIAFSDKKRVDYESIDIVQEARTSKTKKEWKGIFIILYFIQYIRKHKMYWKVHVIWKDKKNKYIELWPQLFFSLGRRRWLKTWYVLNTKCRPKFLFLFHLKKRKGQPWLFSFQNEISNFNWYLLFGIMFLVSGISNEKKNIPVKGLVIKDGLIS